MNKKILSVFLVLCTFLFVLSACSADTQNTETDPVSVTDPSEIVDENPVVDEQTPDDDTTPVDSNEPSEPVFVSTEDFYPSLVYNTTTKQDEPIYVKLVNVHTDIEKVTEFVDAYSGIYDIDPTNPGSSIAQYAVIEYMTYLPMDTPVDPEFPVANHLIDAKVVTAGKHDSAALIYDGISLIGWNVNIGMNDTFLEVGSIYTGYELVILFKDMPSDAFDVVFGYYSDAPVWYSGDGTHLD